ncbi:MAG: DUF3784 domain-containing protein [Faecalibacterium sp.]
MKFLLPLLRNNLLQLSHANQLRYADTKNRTKTITLYMLIAAILMGLLAYLIYSLKIIYSIAWSLEEVVIELVVPMALICVILNIAISVFWGSGLLLSDTNIDSVLALPIPLRTLILSKLSVLFIVEVALTAALLLPMMVLFGLTADMGFPFYLIVLEITILFPVIPGLLGTMIGTQIYRILKSSSARIARLKAAAAILVLFAFMIFMFCKFPDIAAGNFGDVISTSTFTLYAGRYIHRLLNGDYLLIGLYFGGVFLIGVTLLYGLIKIFRNWYSNDAIQGSKSQPVDWNKETTKQHSPVSALLERERTRYFSLPVYLTNTACGLLFAAVFVLLVVLMSDKITPYIYQLAEYFQVPFADYDVLFIYAFSILTTISCTTYVSISIEGKQIEILKSLPIAAKSLFRVKLLHHLSMSVPTIFVLNTIMALYLQWSFPKAMLGYAFPLLCSVLIGMIGYILNLIFPNFEWENVTHIIKQSLPAILTALIGVVVTCGTAYLLLRFFPSSLFIGSWIACAIILLLFLAMVTWVDKKVSIYITKFNQGLKGVLIMWFIWIMWVIVAIAIIATIILLTGKGSMLVSGFNTKSPEERAKYDKEKVSKQTGLLMIFVDVGLLALTSYIQFRAIPAIQNITISDYGTEITIVALGICAYIIVIGIWAAMRGFKNCKNDGTKQ